MAPPEAFRAVVEVRGTTMGGNSGELAGTGSGGNMVVNADDSGALELGGTSGPFTWAATIAPTARAASSSA